MMNELLNSVINRYIIGQVSKMKYLDVQYVIGQVNMLWYKWNSEESL
jgi:hypothetical protein